MMLMSGCGGQQLFWGAAALIATRGKSAASDIASHHITSPLGDHTRACWDDNNNNNNGVGCMPRARPDADECEDHDSSPIRLRNMTVRFSNNSKRAGIQLGLHVGASLCLVHHSRGAAETSIRPGQSKV